MVDPARRAWFAAPLLALLAGCAAPASDDPMQRAYDQLHDQLSDEIDADQAEIARLQGQLKVTLRDTILFPEGGWQINQKARDTLAKLVPTLQGLKNTRIVVEGFTDNIPIGTGLRRMGVTSNLDLSSRRADGVVTFLQSQGVNPSLMSAEGFGDTHPVAANATPAGRAKNRRIELTLVGPGT